MEDVLTSEEAPSSGESVAFQNGTTENATMAESVAYQFIHSVYALGISGIFVWSALILACFQVHVMYVYYVCDTKCTVYYIHVHVRVHVIIAGLCILYTCMSFPYHLSSSRYSNTCGTTLFPNSNCG